MSLRDDIALVVAEIESVHGPYIECSNKGCRDRNLSGLHCLDNDECNEGPHEDCPRWLLAQRLREAIEKPKHEARPPHPDTQIGRLR